MFACSRTGAVGTCSCARAVGACGGAPESCPRAGEVEMARCVCAEALLRRLPAAAASGRAGGAQIWAAQARLGPSQPLCPHPPFSLLPPLPATAGGCRWVVHAHGDPDGCCDAVPRRIPAAEAAGRRGAGDRCRLLDALPVVAGLLALRWPVPKPATTDVPRLPAPCASVFSNVLRHVRSASASEVLAHGSRRNPRAASACAVNGDARGCRHLLGGVGMTLDRTSSSSTGRNPRSGLLDQAAAASQRRYPLEGAALAASGVLDAADGGW